MIAAEKLKRKRHPTAWLIGALLVIIGALLVGAPVHAAQQDALEGAKECVRRLYRSNKRVKYRDQWLRCIQEFDAYSRKYPKGRQADEALYSTGRLYEGLYGYSRLSGDLNEAIERFREIVKRFPRSRFADDAQYRLGEIYLKRKKDQERAYVEFFKVVMDFPDGDMEPLAQKRLAELEARGGKRKSRLSLPRVPTIADEASSARATVTDIRRWSAPDYTRVVIDVDNQVEYAGRLLRADPALETPPRLYIDLHNAALGSALDDNITIGDGLLRKIRAGQYRPRVVRVVLDIESIEQHKIFSLSDPFRIVIDVTGTSREPKPAPLGVGTPSLTLAQQLGLGVKKVVIDPGHGGKDPGAIGPRGIREKKVVLGIAERLKKKLETELELEAVLTRSSDTFMPLEERTAFANTNKADLFISIHTNAHRDRRAHGISTYILNVATDAEAARLAALENATSTKRISSLEKILNDLMLNSKINESTRLADNVQQGLVKSLSVKYDNVKDLGVKQAPFYVLIGARMPCIMVEASFISNPREAGRLANGAYQDAIAQGIMMGIRSYIKQMEKIPGRG